MTASSVENCLQKYRAWRRKGTQWWKSNEMTRLKGKEGKYENEVIKIGFPAELGKLLWCGVIVVILDSLTDVSKFTTLFKPSWLKTGRQVHFFLKRRQFSAYLKYSWHLTSVWKANPGFSKKIFFKIDENWTWSPTISWIRKWKLCFGNEL